MAFKPLVPGVLNPQITIGAGQAYQSTAVKDFSGSAVDLSAYVGLAAKLVPISPNPNTADVSIGTVTADANGIVTLETSPTDLATAAAGAARLVIVGKPGSGDTLQVLAQGTATVQAG